MKTQNFGTTDKGEAVTLYTLNNGKGMQMGVSSLGATIVSLVVPDKDGNPTDVVLGYDAAKDYQTNTYYFGAAIGRNANRICNAECKIDGVSCKLEANDSENNLHSGSNGFHNMVFDAKYSEDKDNQITFTAVSKDKEQDFPGNLTIAITYTLTDDNELVIDYKATTDATTVANFTNHAYYNLNGHTSGSVEGQKLMIAASNYTPVVDSKSIPTGVIETVKGTPFDFTEPKAIGTDIGAAFEQLQFAGGYDHNYVIDGADGSLRLTARAEGDKSGIVMEVYTDLPGVQFYSGNFIKPHTGKGGAAYDFRHGFCLETQYYPNAANQDGFDITILQPGEEYKTTTKMKFTTV